MIRIPSLPLVSATHEHYVPRKIAYAHGPNGDIYDVVQALNGDLSVPLVGRVERAEWPKLTLTAKYPGHGNVVRRPFLL